MADNDHSAALVELRRIPHRATATATTAATAGEHAAAARVLTALRANRAEYFALVESLELLRGREVDALELQCRLDGDFPGCGDLTEREALAILSTAAPLRAVCKR